MNSSSVQPSPEVDPDQTDRLPVPGHPAAEAKAQEVAAQEAEAQEADTGEFDPGQRPDEHAAALAALELKLEEKDAALARLEQELEAAKSTPKRGRRAARRAGKQHERLQQLERELADLTARSEEQQSAVSRLDGELSESREAGQKLERQLAALGAELQDRGRALAAEKANLAASEARIAELESRLAKAASQPAGGATPQERAERRSQLRPITPGAVKMRRFMVRLDGGHEALYELLTPHTSIGRTPENDVQICESFISRSHAVIKLAPDAAVIEDAGSSNGVFVNGRRVIRQLLQDGDSVILGKARFRFEARPQED